MLNRVSAFITGLAVSVGAHNLANETFAAEPTQPGRSAAIEPDPAPKRVTVRAGESLSVIARNHQELGGSIESRIARILEENPQIKNPQLIKPGDQIILPRPIESGTTKPAGPATREGGKSATYSVREGDNLSKIAKANDTTVKTLADLNGLTTEAQRNNLKVGQELKIPAKEPVPQASVRTASNAAAKFITDFEKLKLESYRDKGGTWTIGYGHTGPDVHEGMLITKQEAIELFKSDLQRFERAASKQLGKFATELSDDQFGACVSFAFNCGEGALQKVCAYARMHSNGKLDDFCAKMAERMKQYDKDNGVVQDGLVKRRADEIAALRDGQPLKRQE